MSTTSERPSDSQPDDSEIEARNRRATFTPRTALGKRLWELRQQIVASGASLLDWNQIAVEVRARRGENVGGDAP